MASEKVVFVAFAIEDVRQRDFLKGQSLLTKCPFEYVDMSVKDAYQTEWQEKVRTRIRKSDGVIALISKNSIDAVGQKWEIECAIKEGKKVLGIWAYAADQTKPSFMEGKRLVEWSWASITTFIDSL